METELINVENIVLQPEGFEPMAYSEAYGGER